MSFALGALCGLSLGCSLGVASFFLQRFLMRRNVDTLLAELREEYRRDYLLWWKERHKRDALLARAGYLLLNNLDPCGRPLADPRKEQDQILNAILDSGAMGPRGTTGPSKATS